MVRERLLVSHVGHFILASMLLSGLLLRRDYRCNPSLCGHRQRLLLPSIWEA